jgi:hypothetical protein
MATPDELRAAIAAARIDFVAALESAGDRWDRPSGDPGRTNRQVAEHAAQGEIYLASEVCSACGYPGLDRWEASYPTVADAVAGFGEAAKKSDGRLKYVSDNDLTMVHQHWGTVAGIMEYNITHLKEHGDQLRAK